VSGRIRDVPRDFVARLIALLEQHPRDQWEVVLRTELRGRHYVASSTGRQHVAELVRLGVSARSARAKVYGR
jgi:hypothetical protein